MSPRASTGGAGARALLAVALCLYPAAVSPQEVSLPSLKAAFVANFAKFAEWPAEAVAPGRMFTFCVVGDKPMKAALEKSITQNPGDRAPVTVMFLGTDGPFAACQMLYLGGMDLGQARRILDLARGGAVFTVSDLDGFAETGGTAQLWIDKGQMRFRINPAAAQRARVALSAKLLDLATLVKDGKHESR